MLGYLKPKLLNLTETEVLICIPLKRSSRNHLKSMYFGALTVGADLAGGILAFYHAHLQHTKLSLAFKTFHAQFLSRPESDVFFICSEGQKIQKMVFTTQINKQRITEEIFVEAFTKNNEERLKVAEFTFQLSLKSSN